MRVPPGTRLYLALGLLFACAGCGAMYAGFLLGGWAGVGAGLAACMGTVLLCVRITIGLSRLHTKTLLERFVVAGDVKAEAAAEAVLRTITLYEAAVFPLTARGTTAAERHARRVIAYHFAAHDDLPVSVRVAAAEALEAIDCGQDPKRAQTAVRELGGAVRECRAGHVSVRDERTS